MRKKNGSTKGLVKESMRHKWVGRSREGDK